MAIELWIPPVPVTALMTGPEIAALPGRQCEISFSAEGDEGNVVKVSLVFEAVEAFKCTYLTSLTVDMIDVAYGKLVDIGRSQWLTEIKKRISEYYSKTKGTPPDLLHLMICFDDGPCYEFICVGFKATAI